MFPDVNDLLVADVGCGTGRQTFKLGARGARVVELDFSPAMVGRAQSKGKIAQVYFVLADAVASIPLKSGVLDGAVMQPGSRARRESYADVAATSARLQAGWVCTDFGYTSNDSLRRRRGEF